MAACVLATCAPRGDAPGGASPSPAGSDRNVPAQAPHPSVRAALEALLAAEQREDHAASFKLLSTEGRTVYRDVADWTTRRNELPPITGFTIVDARGDTTTALVEHTPGLDPFRGLSPAKERQTWKGRRERGGFLLDPDPEVEILLPAEAEAKRATEAWAGAVQACDEARARDLQAVAVLFGASEAAAKLCRSAGAVTTGRVLRLPPGPVSADVVAQYSADALEWARVVEVTGPVQAFHVVLAPMGDRWLVIGTYD